MKNEDVHIKRRDREDNLYKRLQDQSLEMIQQLSGNRWTDFNEHDPGVTLMDVLNYALLELDYTCGFPMEDYLADPQTGQLHFEKIGLLPSKEIFAQSIVTTLDYELLFLNQVKGLKDCQVLFDHKNSLYTILVKTKDQNENEKVISDIKRLYHRNRNLCENLGEIRIDHSEDNDKKFRKPIHDVEFEPEQVKMTLPRKKQRNYHSIQYDLPDCYGINDRGLPAGANPTTRNAALQLKAYLLVFDYLLSGTKQQLKSIHQLLDLSGIIPPEFYPDVEIEEIDKLLDTNHLNNTVIFDEGYKHHQKSLFLDYLDMMYGEDTAQYMKGTTGISDQNTQRAKLIRHLPKLNEQRFRSFNLLDEKMKSVPGIKQLIGLVLGYEFKQESPTIKTFIRHDSFTKIINYRQPSFYLIEHILLLNDDLKHGEKNKLTIVIPRWTEKFYPKETYLDLFRERLPAHLDVKCLWLSSTDMASFEKVYFKWRKAWTTENEEKITEYSEEIKILIEN